MRANTARTSAAVTACMLRQRLVRVAHAAEREHVLRRGLEPARGLLERAQSAHLELVAGAVQAHRVDAVGMLAQQPRHRLEELDRLLRRGGGLDDELAAQIGRMSAEQAA